MLSYCKSFAAHTLLGLVPLLLIACADRPMEQDTSAGPQLGVRRPHIPEEPLYEFTLAAGQVEVDKWTHAGTQIAIELTIDAGFGPNYGRKLVLDVIDNDRVNIALLDRFGGFLFGIDVGWDVDAQGVYYTETSIDDELKIDIVRSANITTETYTYEGSSHDLVYPVATEAEMETAYQVYLDADRSLPMADPLAQAILKFHSFYPFSSSVHDNPHGELLVNLVTHEGFNEWITDRSGGVITPGEIESRQLICGIAGVCAGIKCLIGAWANPMCVACGGVALACAVADIALALSAD